MEQYRRAMVEQIEMVMRLDAGSPTPVAPRLAPLDSPGSLGAITPVDLGEPMEYFSGTSHLAGKLDSERGAEAGGGGGGGEKLLRPTLTITRSSHKHRTMDIVTGRRPVHAKVEVCAIYR